VDEIEGVKKKKKKEEEEEEEMVDKHFSCVYECVCGRE
jgi:hypothetical protein